MLNFVSLKLNLKAKIKWYGCHIETKVWILKTKKFVVSSISLKMEKSISSSIEE